MYSHGDISSSMSRACVTSLKQSVARPSRRSAGRISPRPRCSVADLDLLAGQLQPELRGLVRRLEEQLVVVRALLRRLLECEQLVGAQVPLVVACTLRPAGSARTRPRGRSAPAWTRAEHTSGVADLFADAAAQRCQRHAPAGHAPAARDAGRVRRAGARARRRARRSGARSRRTGSARRSSSGRPAAGRRRSPGSSRRPPAPSSRSSPRCRPRSPTSAACWPARASGSARTGQRTILFLDEIHRFNKAQQDALLPAVEEGLVTLIGATTENPYFEVNSALLSRVQLYELAPLEIVRARAGDRPRRGSPRNRRSRTTSER